MSSSDQLGAAARLLLLALFSAGCGEVFADLDVQRRATMEAFLFPRNVAPGMTLYVEIKVVLDEDASSPFVSDHGFDGTAGVSLVSPSTGIWAGKCPSGEGGGLTEADVTRAAGDGEEAKVLKEDGAWVFCTAITVGDLSEPVELQIPLELWDGNERVSGTVSLDVASLDVASLDVRSLEAGAL